MLKGEDSISLMFASPSVYKTQLTITPLYHDPFALFVSNESEFADHGMIDLRELANQIFIQPNSYHTYNERINEVLLELDISPRRRLKFSSSLSELGSNCAANEAIVVPLSVAQFMANPAISKLVQLDVSNENAYFPVVALSLSESEVPYIDKAIQAIKTVAEAW